MTTSNISQAKSRKQDKHDVRSYAPSAQSTSADEQRINAPPRFHFLHDHMHPLAGAAAPLACPFCGIHGHVEFSNDNGAPEPWSAFCGTCLANGPVAASRLDAAMKWNWRPVSATASRAGGAS